MNILDRAKSVTTEARGFAVTDTSDVTFFDVKAHLARDYEEQMMLPPAEPGRAEAIIRTVSLIAGPLLLVFGYAWLARFLI